MDDPRPRPLRRRLLFAAVLCVGVFGTGIGIAAAQTETAPPETTVPESQEDDGDGRRCDKDGRREGGDTSSDDASFT